MARPRQDLFWVMPREWYNKPVSEAVLEYYRDEGYVDEKGNITPEGRKHGVVKEKILGTETREHYEEYLKHWDPFFEKWWKWANDERIPWEEQPNFEYKEKWESEQ